MHYQASAMKTWRALKGNEGVEIVIADLKDNNVMVSGKVNPQKPHEWIENKLVKRKWSWCSLVITRKYIIRVQLIRKPMRSNNVKIEVTRK